MLLRGLNLKAMRNYINSLFDIVERYTASSDFSIKEIEIENQSPHCYTRLLVADYFGEWTCYDYKGSVPLDFIREKPNEAAFVFLSESGFFDVFAHPENKRIEKENSKEIA